MRYYGFVPIALFVLACGGSPGGDATRSETDAAAPLQDLVGARGSSADTQLEARGYTAVGGHAEGAATVVSYWRSGDGRCVAVRGGDGRIESIASAAAQACDDAERATRVVAAPDPGGHRTPCGVMLDGEPVRYVCSVVGGDQRRAPTTLRFPDLVLVLDWQDAGRVQVGIEGSQPIDATWAEAEGETTITAPEKTWFFVSDPERAARELAADGGGGVCSDAWYRTVEARVGTGDGQGHGPDPGSDEWKSVVEFRLGVRGRPDVPPRDGDAWCRYVEGLLR
jgi:hypothetical protein